MDRIDYRRDKSKPMPKKQEGVCPGRIVNIYDVSTKAFIGPGVMAGPALNESGLVALICLPAVDWRNFDDEIVVGTKVEQAGAVSHVSDAVEGDDWAWAWPQEYERLKKEGWGK